MADPPKAPTTDTLRRYHDLELPDPYAWLRTENWQAALRDPAKLDPAIRAYLEAENAYAESVLAPTGDLRQRLKAELRGRIKERDSGVPLPDGPYAYYLRYEEGQQHPLYCRCPRDDESGAGEEVLLDGNAAAEGQPFFRVAQAAHSPDHRLFAYAVDLTGSEYHRLRVRDLQAGGERDLGVDSLQGDFAWASDGRTLVYTALDDNHRPSRVYRIALDDPQPELIYEEPDSAFYLGVTRTESRRYIVIAGGDHSDTTELRLLDCDAPWQPPRLLFARQHGVDYDLAERDGELFIRTNADGARDYRIVTAPADAPEPANWREVVPHRPGVLIKAMVLTRDHLVRLELAEARPRIVVRELAGGAEHTVALEDADPAYALSLVPGLEFDTGTLRMVYSSPRQPQRTYDYDMAARRLTLRKEQEVPSGHDPAAYAVRRLDVPGHDGAPVPVTLLHRADSPPEPGRPLLLYGYGAYGIAIPDSFQPNWLSLVDRGMVFAVAHVRGGSERGYGWYLDGKLAKKENTFRDFIAVADRLVAENLVRPGDIVANGRSAGGMLMGVVANWRPELFRAVVAEVPFLDVLNTMCDAELPLTPPEWSEWGNPLEDREACRRIAGYSPYDNVAPQPYPAILATAGIADPRVTYWEPAKWVARLRASTTGRAPIVLHTNMGAGHAGASGRFERLDEVALVQAFILMIAGLAEGAGRDDPSRG